MSVEILQDGVVIGVADPTAQPTAGPSGVSKPRDGQTQDFRLGRGQGCQGGGAGGGKTATKRSERLAGNRPLTMDEVRAEWPLKMVWGAELESGLIDGLDLKNGETPRAAGYGHKVPYTVCRNPKCPGGFDANGKSCISYGEGERVVSGGLAACAKCGWHWTRADKQRCFDVPRWRLRPDSMVYEQDGGPQGVPCLKQSRTDYLSQMANMATSGTDAGWFVRWALSHEEERRAAEKGGGKPALPVGKGSAVLRSADRASRSAPRGGRSGSRAPQRTRSQIPVPFPRAVEGTKESAYNRYTCLRDELRGEEHGLIAQLNEVKSRIENFELQRDALKVELEDNRGMQNSVDDQISGLDDSSWFYRKCTERDAGEVVLKEIRGGRGGELHRPPLFDLETK